MHNTIYEQCGGSYTQVGDYLLPDLLPGSEEHSVGIWGRRHARWLRQNRRVTYTNLLTSGSSPAIWPRSTERRRSSFPGWSNSTQPPRASRSS